MSFEEYEAVRGRGYQAMVRGDLKAARADLLRAREMAAELTATDPEIVDKAEVNLAMIRVQLHEDEEAERGLREVLLRSSNDDVIRLAAHCLAKVLSHQNEHDRALRFARTSLEKACGLADPLKEHSALQLMGAVLANQSHLEEALDYYERAFEIIDREPLPDATMQAFYWSAASDMVGYVHTLLGHLDEGRRHLEQAHARCRQHDIRDLIAETAADLCFAALQAGRLDDAWEHGSLALEIAEADGLDFHRRNAYYLLGEVASRQGDDALADSYYAKLAEFYPQVPFLGDFLREYDISSLINLKEFA